MLGAHWCWGSDVGEPLCNILRPEDGRIMSGCSTIGLLTVIVSLGGAEVLQKPGLHQKWHLGTQCRWALEARPLVTGSQTAVWGTLAFHASAQVGHGG